MIVRIATEGQYRMDDSGAEKLNELDNAVVEAVDSGDEPRYTQAFATLIAFVRDNGSELGDEELEESQVIIPPADTSLAEASEEFTGEGLIPG